MIEIEIPGFGQLKIKHLVCDYSGTLSVDGVLVPGVRERLDRLADKVDIHIVTADTHGRVKGQVTGTRYRLILLTGADQDIQKEDYIKKLGAEQVAAIGNGSNDRRMLALAGVGIAVCLKEGVAVEALKGARILTNSINDALDLLLFTDRLKATLRF
jgi:soluble P-type ATPase